MVYSPRRQGGLLRVSFTLIELLVVVAVLALLASILLPALRQAREETKAAVCAANLHTLGTALTMYVDANGGWFPEWGFAHGGGEAGAARAWINTLARDYGENRDVLRCPVDRSPHWTRPLAGRLRRTSYAGNYYVTTGGEDNPLFLRDGHAYNRLDWIRHPTRTIFFAELAEVGQYAASDHVHVEYWVEFYPDEREQAERMVAIDRHRRQAMYGLIDGHVERLPFEKTYFIRAVQGEQVEWLYNKYDPTIAR